MNLNHHVSVGSQVIKKINFFTMIIAGLMSLVCFSYAKVEHKKTVEQNKSAEIVFEKEKIKIGNKTITVEIADNHEKQAYGLMHRSSLNTDQGMLFIFSDEQVRSFWMKNTFVPLSIGYFDAQKKLIDIQDMKPTVRLRNESRLVSKK